MQSFLSRVCLFIWFPIHLGAFRLLEDACETDPIDIRIVNGSKAAQEAAAWMALVTKSDIILCGGTLIHKRFVLTAAHCIQSQENLFVRLGAFNISQPFAQYSVSHAEMHSSFNSFGSFENDIGLLRLSKSVDFSASIYPICLIMDNSIKSHVENMRLFQAFGWGRRSDGLNSEILQTITLNHLDRAECKRILKKNTTLNQICVGSLYGDTCTGDSGGPLTTNYNGRQTQFGIISYGTTRCDGPGVYTDVSSYVDWIEDTIKTLDSGDDSQGLSHDENIWLYEDCGGNDTTGHPYALIAGRFFNCEGVLITDRFVLTNVRGLPTQHKLLSVTVKHMGMSIGEYSVDAVFIHPHYSTDTNNIHSSSKT